MASKGDPELTISGLTFSQDPTDDGCLQSSNYADTADELEYLCNNRHIKLAGAYTAGWTGSIAIAATDVATLAALKSASILTDFAYYPFGNTAGNIGHTSNSATVFGFTYGEAVNSIVLVDFAIAVNNPVDAAAT